MRTWLYWRCLIVAMLVLLPVSAAAQEAVITGTVKDSSDGVVPGVTVVAVHEATGNKFVAVTDAQKKAEQAKQAEMGKLTGGLPFKLPF